MLLLEFCSEEIKDNASSINTEVRDYIQEGDAKDFPPELPEQKNQVGTFEVKGNIHS